MFRPFGGYFMAGSISFINSSLISTNGQNLIFGDLLALNIPGSSALIYMVHSVTGLSYDILQWIPLNYILIALALFCLSIKLLGSKYFAVAISISVIFLLNFKFDIGDYSFFVKGTGLFFFVMFLLVTYEYIVTKKIVFFALMLVFFISNHFFDYTTQAWMIIAVIPFVLIGTKTIKSASVKNLASAFFLMVVIFLGFREIIYKGYMPWMNPKLIGQSFSRFFGSNPITSYADANPFAYTSHSLLFFSVINALILLILIVIPLLFILYLSYKLIKGHRIIKDDLIIISIFLVLPITVLIYLPIGLLVLGYAILMFPLLCALCIKRYSEIHNGSPQTRKRFKPIRYALPIVVITLLALSMVSYSGVVSSGLVTTSNSDMKSGATWLLMNSKGPTSILSDQDTLGKFQIVWSNSISYQNLSIQFYSLESYRGIADPQSNSRKEQNVTNDFNYILIDSITDMPAKSQGWVNFEPLKQYQSQIALNPNISRIYYDETCMILTANN
jgi:hypothetical protein